MDKDTIIKLELTIEEINIVMAGLSELPIKLSLKTLQRVEEQARAQIDQPAAPVQ